jgi:hypothetical protein
MDLLEQLTGRLPADDSAWLNDKDVCGYLNISTKTLQRLRNSGDVRFSAIGKKYFYKSGDIKAMMERKAAKSGREQVENLRNFHSNRLRK